MEIFVTVRCNVECSISVKQKDATSNTENYGPYTKPGRREKMHTEFVGSQLRTKYNREDNRRKDYRERILRTVAGGCYSLKIFQTNMSDDCYTEWYV